MVRHQFCHFKGGKAKFKSGFNFEDLFGDGSDFSKDETDFFGGFDFVKKHFGDFFKGFEGFDGMDLDSMKMGGGNFKFSSTSSFSSTKNGVKVEKTVHSSSGFKNGKQANINYKSTESKTNKNGGIEEKAKNVKCGYVNKEVSPGKFAKVYECDKQEL